MRPAMQSQEMPAVPSYMPANYFQYPVSRYVLQHWVADVLSAVRRIWSAGTYHR